MELNTILNIMTKYGLTADELLLVYLTFISQTENGRPEEHRIYFKRWYDGGGKERLRSLFDSLKAKGVIKKNYNPNVYDPDEIEFNQNFIKQYFKLTGELGQELMNAYPTTLYINGRNVSLKNISKKFKDLQEFYFWYASTIGHSRSKHQEILSILEWAKMNDLIHIPIVEFVASCKWNEFAEMKAKGMQGQASMYDIIETV
jgi:hypothetical protein